MSSTILNPSVSLSELCFRTDLRQIIRTSRLDFVETVHKKARDFLGSIRVHTVTDHHHRFVIVPCPKRVIPSPRWWKNPAMFVVQAARKRE